MMKKRLGLVALLSFSVALASCGGGGGGSSDGGSTGMDGGTTDIGGTTGTDGTTDGTTDGGGSNGESFFNEDNGISFANGVGASISRLFTVGFGGANGRLQRIDSADDLVAFINRARTSETVDCDSGSVTVFSDTDDATGAPTGGGVDYNDCVIEGVSASGSLSFTTSTSADGSSSTITMTFDNFSSSADGESSSINGTVSISIASDDNGVSFSISGPSLDLVDSQGAISFTDYNLTAVLSTATGSQSLSAAVTMADESGVITMAIDPAFVIGSEDEYPTTGVQSWTHSDGSSLTIDADSGNPDTFNYTISDGSSVTSGEERWDNTDLNFDGL